MLEACDEEFVMRAQDNESIQPVPLLLLDINMPYNGIDAIRNIKALYDEVNGKLR